MSASKGSKRISVFDRLGPGNDESAPSHRRYSSEKQASSSGGQEKGRGHTYGPPVPSSAPLRTEERERKARHRGSLSGLTDGEEKRQPNLPPPLKLPNPPPLKSTPEVVKSVKAAKPTSTTTTTATATTVSGESDCESGEEAKQRRGFHGDQDMPHRGDYPTDGPEEEANRRTIRGKDKVHHHSERPSSSSSGSHHRTPPPPGEATSKQRSRREGGGSAANEHKQRRKEEEVKTPSELGHKRKRDHEDAYLHETKRVRHGDGHSSRDSDHHHGSSTVYSSSVDKKWRQESEVASRKQHSAASRPLERGRSLEREGGRSLDRERGRSLERERGGRPGTSKGHKHISSSSSSNNKKGTALQEKEHVRASEGRSRAMDWAALNSYTEKANSKLKYQCPMAVLKKFTPAASFAATAVSPALAGPRRYRLISELVKSYLKEGSDEDVSEHWVAALQGSESTTPTTPPKSGLDWDKTIAESLGPCRRALTASDDYVLRRLLRKEQRVQFMSPAIRPAPNSWATGHYEIALNFYNALPTKPSGKPSHRLQASKVGTLVL